MDVGVSLDNFVLVREEVGPEKFNKLVRVLDHLDTHAGVSQMKYWVGTDYKGYHHNYKFGEGEGALIMQYKHNSKREGKDMSYDLRIECNPNKLRERDLLIYKAISDVLPLSEFPHSIRVLDLAFDVAVEPKNVFVTTLTGVDTKRYNDNRFYGVRGKDGHLKVYNKKREQKEKFNREIDEDALTRIEYTYKPQKGVKLAHLKKNRPKLGKRFEFSIVGQSDAKPDVLSFIFAIREGLFEYKQFTRSQKVKIKEALQSMESLDVDTVLSNSWLSIHRTIESLVWGELPNELNKLYTKYYN